MEFQTNKLRNIYYFGHHKCASNWMRCIFLKFAEIYKYNYKVIRGNQNNDIVDPSRANTVYLNVNSRFDDAKVIPGNCKGVHVFRDPRDVLISDYFSIKYSHKNNNEKTLKNREFFNEVSVEEGLEHLINVMPYEFQMRNWAIGSITNILDVKYEDLLVDEYFQFKKIFTFLNTNIEEADLTKIVDKCSFKSITKGRERGEEDKKAHFRKGISGDWKNYMPEKSKLYQKFIDKHADMLKQLGYTY